MKIHGAKVVPLTHILEVDKTDTMFGSRINSSVNASLPKITHSYRVTLNENKIFSKCIMVSKTFLFMKEEVAFTIHGTAPHVI